MKAKRSKRPESREAFRQRLGAWVLAHGGVEVEPAEHLGTTHGVMGGSWRLQTRRGPLLIHMPCDGWLHIHSRFEAWGDAQLPPDANQYSGKWNFYADDEDYLFNLYTRLVEILLGPPPTSTSSEA